MEKLKAIKQYIYDNYTYTTDRVMCNTGAEALLFAARDLGLPARYRFVGPQYDYEKGYGDVYYHFGSAYCFGHVCTIFDCIVISSKHETGLKNYDKIKKTKYLDFNDFESECL